MKLQRVVLTTGLAWALALSGCNLPMGTQSPRTETASAVPTEMATANQPPERTDTPMPPPASTNIPTAVPTESVPDATSTPDALPTSGADPVAEIRRIQEEGQNPPFLIDIEYPFFSDSGGSPLEGLNREVDAMVNRQYEEFQKMAAASTPPPDTQTGPNSLYIRYELLYNANRLVSIAFQMSLYNQGAAHPLPYSETLTYDLGQDRRLELADVFQPGVDYLDLLSKRSIEDLNRQGMLMWEDGALPRAENFKSWNLTPEGLRITFDPYQVAAYAAGYQKVVLPWNTLAGDLNPALGVTP